MKLFISSLLVALAGSLALPATANAKIDSVYTSLNGPTCKPLEENAEEGWAKGRCEGAAGYQLDWMEGDLRQSINVIAPDGTEFPLELWSTVSSGFSALGDKAEWRVQMEEGKTTPIALIVRYNVSEDPEQPEKTTSYLAVSKITAGKACVTDVVKPSADANQQARDLADVAASKPCIGTGTTTTEENPSTTTEVAEVEKEAATDEQVNAEDSGEVLYYLCEPEEQVVFGCNSQGKMISLCASPDVGSNSGYMQYRFGTLDKVELTYPKERVPPKGYFWHSFASYSGGYAERVRFDNTSVQYVVFEDMLSTGPASLTKEMHYGVSVQVPGKKAVSRLCDASGEATDGSGSAKGFIFDHQQMGLGDWMDNEAFNYDLELHPN